MRYINILSLGFTSVVSSTLNQLSFSGGGAFGAVEIGILKHILEQEQEQSKYDLYTGISAGALNAGFLSYYEDISEGVKASEEIYSGMKNSMIYNMMPFTGISVLNTTPLRKTLTNIINDMPNNPIVHTLIGATNLYSGHLDIFRFEDNVDTDKVNILMSSSAIPGLFPPIQYRNMMYADGGTLGNELLQVEHNGYLNITFITPYEGYIYNDSPITDLEDMLKRTMSIVVSNYNNEFVKMNMNCVNPIGELHYYYVSSEYLQGYNMLNFNDGSKLVEIGYRYAKHEKYVLC